jgi:rod shape-determining protein MreD
MLVNDMSQNRRIAGILALVCCILQLALTPQIGLGNGRINFMAILAACIAMQQGGRTGVLAGFLSGLFFDLCTTGPIGLMAFELTLAAWVMGHDGRNRIGEGMSESAAYFAPICAGICLVYNLAMLLVGQVDGILDAVFLRALPTFVLTFAFFLPFSYFLGRRPQGGSGVGGSSLNLGGGSRSSKHLSMKGL